MPKAAIHSVADRRWVGLRLRHVRELAGVTRDQMATACGVTPAAVSHWELGRSLPDTLQTLAWGRAVGMPTDMLLRELDLARGPADDPAPPTSLRAWWLARHESGVTSRDAGGVTSAQDDGNAALGPSAGPLPRAERRPRAAAGAPERRAEDRDVA